MKIEKVDDLPVTWRTPRGRRMAALIALKPGEIKCYTPEEGDTSPEHLAVAFRHARRAREDLKDIVIMRRGESVFIHRPEEES